MLNLAEITLVYSEHDLTILIMPPKCLAENGQNGTFLAESVGLFFVLIKM